MPFEFMRAVSTSILARIESRSRTMEVVSSKMSWAMSAGIAEAETGATGLVVCERLLEEVIAVVVEEDSAIEGDCEEDEGKEEALKATGAAGGGEVCLSSAGRVVCGGCCNCC